MVRTRGRRTHALVLLSSVGVLFVVGGRFDFAGAAVAQPQLRISSAAERDPSRPLRGAQAAGKIYVFLGGDTSAIERVQFFLDDPRMAKRPLRVVVRPPFDMAGQDRRGRARPFDTTTLAHGRHTIAARLQLEDGRSRVVRAAFSVPHLFVSSGASDVAACSKSSPCGSLDRAYDLARPGQVVEVAGSFAGQTLTGTKPTAAGKVIFRLGGSSVEELRVEADHLEIQGGRVSYWEARSESDGLIVRGVDSNLFGIYGSANTSVIGGDVGPSYAPGGVTSPVFITVGTGGDPRNVLIDGVEFHDFRAGQEHQHLECIQVVAVSGLTIRNSRFRRCDIYSVFFTQWAGPNPPHDILLENNWFDQSTADGQYCCTTYAVVFSGHMTRYSSIHIRYNSWKQPFVFDGSAPRTNVRVVGNLGVNDGCDPRISYAFNVWQWDNRSVACAATDRVMIGQRYGTDRLGYVDAGAFNLRLTPTSPAIDRGDPNVFPRRDIFGTRRPLGRRPDAGAVEAR